MLELPFSRLETYCCVQPIRLASSTWVTDCSSIARIICRVMIREYLSQYSLSLRHCALSRQRDWVGDWCASRNSIVLLSIIFHSPQPLIVKYLIKSQNFSFCKDNNNICIVQYICCFYIIERYWQIEMRERTLLPLKLPKAQISQRNNVFRFVFCEAIPIFPITATIPYSWCVTSGANTSLHTLYPPNVSHQEITNLLYTAIYGTFLFF